MQGERVQVFGGRAVRCGVVLHIGGRVRDGAVLHVKRGLPRRGNLQPGNAKMRTRGMQRRPCSRGLRRGQVLLGNGNVQRRGLLHRRRLWFRVLLHRWQLQAVLQEQQRLPGG